MTRATVARIAALAILAGPPALGSAAEAFQLFPVRGVFVAPAGDQDLVDEQFRSAIGDAEKTMFARRFRERFPAAVPTIGEENQRRALAVSLQISRASRFTSTRTSGTVDLYLPVTASIYFTSVMTGEVLFASTSTRIVTQNVKPGGESDTARIQALYLDAFRALVDELVDDAAKRFSPRTVTAVVRKEWYGLAILDAGTGAGIAAGDAVVSDSGAELSVVYSAPTYSVARAQLGTFRPGEPFSKLAHGTLDSLKRPRVLGLVEDGPAALPRDALLQIFADALGAEAPVALVLVNPTFGQVLTSIKQQTAVSQQGLKERPTPELFVRLHVAEPVTWETPTNLEWKTLRVTDALAYAELVDRTGRVLLAAQGRDRIRDEITQGSAIDLAGRQEIAVKNALVALASRFASLKLEPAALDVTAGGPEVRVADPGGALVPGAQARVFRSIGRVGGIDGDVLVPTWEVDVAAVEGDAAALGSGLPVTKDGPAPAKGDKVLVVAAPGKGAVRRRLGPCGTAEKLGAIDVAGYETLATNLFAAASPTPFFVQGLAGRVEKLVSGATGFRSGERFPVPTLDYCVQPVHRIDPLERKCDSKGCADVVTVRLTYRLRAAATPAEVKFRRGMESRLTAGMLPSGASGDAHARALSADLVDEILKVASAAAASLKEEKL